MVYLGYNANLSKESSQYIFQKFRFSIINNAQLGDTLCYILPLRLSALFSSLTVTLTHTRSSSGNKKSYCFRTP